MLALRRIKPQDLPRLKRLWREHWMGEEIIVHGAIFQPGQVEGLVSEDWTGLVTCVIEGNSCEIISLDSLKEGRGTGTRLVEAVVREAGRRACRRVFLSTRNDNLRALRFYQRRDFELVRIRRGAIAEARGMKPGIPLIGETGIPLRDELELELLLPAQRNVGPGA